MKKLSLLLLFLLILNVRAFATQIVYGTVYSTNGQVTNVNLNGDFNNVSSVVNGNLDNTNANTTNGYRFYQSVSSLPAAGNTGQVYFLTTDDSLNFDTGSTFIKTIAPSGTPAQGNVLIYGASGLVYTATGTSGQALLSNGPASNPTFQTLSLTASNVGSLVGTTTTGLTVGTAYHATTDGFLSCYGVGGNSSPIVQLLIDSSSSPSTVVASMELANGYGSQITFLVKKSNYYECYNSNSGNFNSAVESFTSIGS